jgi:hypothetical protein
MPYLHTYYLTALRNMCLYNHCHRTLLAAGSEYFRKRLEGWDDDPLAGKDTGGRRLLVVQLEEDLIEAGQALLKLMYEEVVPQEVGLMEIAKVWF